jgi:hypothetical protein
MSSSHSLIFDEPFRFFFATFSATYCIPTAKQLSLFCFVCAGVVRSSLSAFGNPEQTLAVIGF